jgi:hypothetical protein
LATGGSSAASQSGGAGRRARWARHRGLAREARALGEPVAHPGRLGEDGEARGDRNRRQTVVAGVGDEVRLARFRAHRPALVGREGRGHRGSSPGPVSGARGCGERRRAGAAGARVSSPTRAEKRRRGPGVGVGEIRKRVGVGVEVLSSQGRAVWRASPRRDRRLGRGQAAAFLAEGRRQG